jgi:SMC interacting uncharacterized protein involved in chromosome segregation
MSQQTKDERIKTLNKTQEIRKKETLAKVNQAIERLVKTGAKISFATIAREANVSVPYLYKYTELKERIQNLRTQQTQMSSTPINKPPVTAKAHSQIIGKLKQRIQKLEAENQELKRKNEGLAGQVYRVHYLEEQIERQQSTIERLQQRLQEVNPQSKVTLISEVKMNKKQQKNNIDNININDIYADLKELGIKLNTTLQSKIESKPLYIVKNAIEALKQAIFEGQIIRSPGGWLAEAIESEWVKNEEIKPDLKHSPVENNVSPVNSNLTSFNQEELATLSELQSLSNLFEE